MGDSRIKTKPGVSTPACLQMASALDVSLQLNALGYEVTPVATRGKKPIFGKNWSKTIIPPEEYPSHFNGRQNVGIMLGPLAGGVVDIDLDHPLARELAPKYLPETDAVYGRESSPASHYLYRVDGVIQTRKVNVPKSAPQDAGQSLVELRAGSKDGNCMQSVGPGSVHRSGEPIRWEPGINGRASRVSAEDLQTAFKALRAECLKRLCDVTGESRGIQEEDRRAQEKIKEDPAPVLPCTLLSSPVTGNAFNTIEDLIADCLPSRPGQRRECLFRLARGLKFNQGWGDEPEPKALRAVFERWHALAFSRMSGDTSKDESWIEFEFGYERAICPIGLSATVPEAFSFVVQHGSPPEAAETYKELPDLQRLAAVCWAKQHLVGDQSFMLSASECAQVVFRKDYTECDPDDSRHNNFRSRADRFRKNLEKNGLIQCTDRGQKGHGGRGASRFRYTGPSTPYPWAPDGDTDGA